MTTLNLPDDLKGYVATFTARRRRVAVVRAAGRAAMVAVGVMVLSCVLDRLLALPPEARLVLLIANMCFVVLILLRPLRQMFRSDIRWLDEAQVIENQDPRFQERLQTVTSQLLEKPELRGSSALLGELAKSVTLQTDPRDALRLIPSRLAFAPWLGALALLAGASALLLVSWLDMPRLLARYTAPLAGIAPVTTTRLELLSPATGGASLVQGMPLTVTVRTQRLPERTTPVLEMTSDGGETFSRVAMPEADAPSDFSFHFATIDRPFSFRVSGGDARTSLFRVDVVPRPVVTEFRIRYVYPPYMNRPPLSISNTDGLIEAPVGTEAQLAVVASQPLASVTLGLAGREIGLQSTIEPTVFQTKLKLDRDASYTVKLASSAGVDGAGPTGSSIRVLPDRTPLVQWIRPETDLRLGPRDLLPTQYRALDDFGLMRLAIRVQVNASEPRWIPVKLSRDSRLNEGSHTLDLAGLGSKVGDVVMLALEAEDALGQKSVSDERRVLISPRSMELNTHQRLVELRGAEELARQLVAELDEAHQAMQDARVRQRDRMDLEGGWVSRAYQHLAGADEAAGGLKQALLRTIIVTTARGASTAVASLLDEVQQVADEVARVDDEDFESSENRPRRGLAEPLELARRALKDVTTMSVALRAEALLAERENVRRVKVDDGPDGEVAKLQMDRARQDVDTAVRGLGLDPNAGDLDAKLASLVRAGEDMNRSRKPVSWTAASTEWGKQIAKFQPRDALIPIDARLSIAALSEAVRPMGDLVWARDLQLASTATLLAQKDRASGIESERVTEMSKDFSMALQLVRRAHRARQKEVDEDGMLRPDDPHAQVMIDALESRNKLRRWAGQPEVKPSETTAAPTTQPTLEQLAMDANAATAQRQYDTSTELDRRREEAAQSSGSEPDATRNASQPENVAEKASSAAKKIDELQKAQESLRQETTRTKPQAAQALAEKQKKMSEAIASAQEQVRPEDQPMIDSSAADARRAASQAIQAAQEKLAALPGQLSNAERATGEKVEAQRLAETSQNAAEQAQAEARAQHDTAAQAATEAALAEQKVPEAQAQAEQAKVTAQQATDAATKAEEAFKAAQEQASQRRAEAEAAEEVVAKTPPAAPTTGPSTPEESAQNQASSAAQEASTWAQDAARKAGEAESVARVSSDAAKKNAEQAQQTATQAQAEAEGASQQANDARENADKAQANAHVAQQTARARLSETERAVAQALDAGARATPALEQVHPDVAQEMSRELLEFAPETQSATDAIDQKLAPALRQLRQASSESNPASVAQATQAARDAIEHVQQALRAAQDQLIDQDPLAAAEWFAQEAAAAMEGNPPDLEKAASKQQNVSAALQRAWNDSVSRAARARLSGTAQMSSLFQINPTQPMPSGEAIDVPMSTLPLARDWGRLRQRTPEQISAGSRENDPPGYEESLKAYFEALGTSRSEAKQ